MLEVAGWRRSCHELDMPREPSRAAVLALLPITSFPLPHPVLGFPFVLVLYVLLAQNTYLLPSFWINSAIPSSIQLRFVVIYVACKTG